MRTRTLFLLAPVFLALAARGWSQATPPAGQDPSAAPAPFNATLAPVEPAAATLPVAAPAPMATAPAAEVTIKEAEPVHGTVAKGKDSSGKETLSVDFPDEDVRNILRNVADLFELNLVIPEALQGKASIKLRDVTWRQIFQVVLQPLGHTFIEEGNIIKIVSNESLLQEPVSTEIFVVNYARAADLSPTLKALVTSPGSKIDIDTRSNSLVITEAPSRMSRIRAVIEQLDRATDQVMIESKFVEVTDGDVRNIGVNWASLKNYKVGVGAKDNEIGTYTRDQTGDRANGNSRKQDSASTLTNGTNGSTSDATTNTQSSGSTTASGLTSTNGVTTATAATTVNGTRGTTITGGVTAGTTSGSTSTSGDTLSLLNSIAGGTATTRTLNAVFSADQFGLVVSALNELTTAKVVSNPTVVTLNNTEAFINIGKEYPLPSYTYNEQRGSFEVSGFNYKPIGIILKVTPQVNGRGYIKLAIEPEVSSFNDADSVVFGGATGAKIPVIQTKRTKTQISLRDGYTMGIGGLIDSTTSNGETKVPVLGSIPVLGRLFSSKSKSTTSRNLLIFITAKTIPAEGAPPGVIFDPRQMRAMNLRPDDLPGFRDGSDPFAPLASETDAAKKKAKKSDGK